MKFIKHLSVKRMGSLYSHDSWKWLIQAGWVFKEICSSRELQDCFSVHHKEGREVELTQKDSASFCQQTEPGFCREFKGMAHTHSLPEELGSSSAFGTCLP